MASASWEKLDHQAREHLRRFVESDGQSRLTARLDEIQSKQILEIKELDSLIDAAAGAFLEAFVLGQFNKLVEDWVNKDFATQLSGGIMSGTDDRNADKMSAMISRVEAFVQKGERLLSDLKSLQAEEEGAGGASSSLKQSVIQALQSATFVKQIEDLIEDTKESPDAYAALKEMGERWIKFVAKMFEPVEDDEEVAFMASQICGALRSNWFIINTAMGYKMANGDFDPEITYAGSLVSMILEALEPFAHGPSLGQIYTAISSKAA